MLNDVDKVISVSKLKAHRMVVFTGAVKNLFGVVPGLLKAEYHLNMPKKEDFADALIDICLEAKPVLSFMDGIIGMEGEGPTAGKPRAVNVLIASDSPYHLDKVACEIIGLPFNDVPTIKNCIKRGICSNGLSDIELRGDDIESFKIHDFDIPKSKDFVDPILVPEALRGVANRLLRPIPAFKQGVCTSCGICAERCPVKVIKMRKNENKLPALNTKECIRCYCCHELCPNKAIMIKEPIISRLLFGRWK
jgi:ferredoxin